MLLSIFLSGWAKMEMLVNKSIKAMLILVIIVLRYYINLFNERSKNYYNRCGVVINDGIIIELIQGYDLKKAIKVSFGSIIAFLASTIAQAIVMFIMVIWFIVDVFILN